MFGYVTPCKMELKMKDYEKFKAYYCGLCKSIKNNIGNLPRFSLNYDMTFLAVLLDSLSETNPKYTMQHCMVHPVNKKLVLIESPALKYSAYFNTILSYYKLVDNFNDDKSIKSKVLSIGLKPYINNYPDNIKVKQDYVERKLNELNLIESSPKGKNIDEISHPFADLTGYILSSYIDSGNSSLYWLGYNLGKWIYIIDSFDDLEKDMNQNKFNALESTLNIQGLTPDKFTEDITSRVDFVLTTCAEQCLHHLNKLPLKKNEELLYNILQYGLLEKMDKVFKRSGCENEKSL